MRSVAVVMTLAVIAVPALASENAWRNSHLVETLRIDELDGPDEYIFGGIRDLAVGPDGTIYVADAQAIRVRQYSADGKYIQDIGRFGEGPGEHRQLLGIKCLSDGQLVLFSSDPHRVSIYGPEGGHRWSISFESGLFTSSMLECDVEGHIYVKEVVGKVSTVDEWTFVLLEMSQRGDTLGRIELPHRNPPRSYFLTVNTAQGLIYPFTEMTCYAWSPLGYLVVGRNDAYSIALIDKDGREFRRFEHPFERIPVTSAEREDWQAWADAQSRDGTKHPFPLPKLKPVFRDIFVGDDGRIWVSRYVPAEKRDIPSEGRRLLAWREPTTFDVFEPEGVFLGPVVIPRDVEIGVWRGQEMWGVLTGDEGPQIVRYRIDLN